MIFVSPPTETLTVLSSSMNSNVLVSGVKDSAQQTQMENLAEDIAAVATSLPIQPTNVRYPVTLYSNKPRSFNPEWFKLYPWLEYSVKQDACFCFLCHMFGSNGGMSTSKPEKAFTVLGFKDWKHATGKNGILKSHDNSHSHKQAVVVWKDLRK